MTIKILSSASTLPERIVTNADLEKSLDTSDAWITKMTGIKQRHILGENESYLECTFQAAQQAIENAHLKPDDIDLIILATSTPWQTMPSTAVLVQGKLGIQQCTAFDLQAACAGFVYAVYMAYQIMKNDATKRHALLLGCEAFSKVVDWSDRQTCILFGDGFGAMVLGKAPEQKSAGILHCDVGSDGKGKQDLEIPWGLAQGYDMQEKAGKYLCMNGREVFKKSVYYFAELITNTLKKNNIITDDIDWIIPHQANIRIIDAVIERLNIPKEKFVVTLAQHANTSAASIPLAYDALAKSGKIKSGDLVLLIGFGAGYTWGTTLVRV